MSRKGSEVLGSPITSTYDYNEDRDLTKITRPDGAEILYNYDAAGRIESVDSPEGQLTSEYDPQTKQLSSLTTEDGQQTTFTYDGPLQTAQTYNGEVDGSIALTYDNLLRLSGFTTPAGSTTYDYDRDSLLTSAGGMSLTRHPQTGLITSTSVASATTTTAYNQFAEPTTQTYAFPGGAFSETYERDDAGRIAAKNVTAHGNQSRYVYTYDPAGRLTDVTKDGNPWRTYAYDANSNRTSVTRAGEPAKEATFDAQDKMLNQGETQLIYNANGELTKKQSPSSTLELDYTSSGQLKAAETNDHNLTYSYDALGNRTLKKVDGATTQAFLYAPGILGPVAQLSEGSSTETSFVYATRTNVPDLMVRGGTTYRLITDQLGSVRLVVNASTGAVAQEIEYDPFGEVISDSNPGFQPFGFAGGLYDPETGLTHFGAREYDAELGRWTARDPIGFAGGDSNLYGYVVQDPVNLVDPYGLFGLGDAWQGAKSVGRFIGKHADTFAMVAAAGACIASASACAGALAISSAVSFTKNAIDFATGKTCLKDFAIDSLISAAPLGIGKASGMIATATRESSLISRELAFDRGIAGKVVRGNLISAPLLGSATLNEGLDGGCGC